ncbi:unnamed protein product [Dicrocoelium dendriticum]|nr:unnamed protein product [Dicrocoelium dendriticum]
MSAIVGHGVYLQFVYFVLQAVISRALDITAKQQCSAYFSNTSEGNIVSRNYPNYYDPDDFCSYEVEVPSGQRVKIAVSELELLEDDGYYYDYLVLFDGPNCASPRVEVLTNGKDEPIITTSNHFSALHVASKTLRRKGFNITYTSIAEDSVGTYPEFIVNCGHELTSPEGVIEWEASDGDNLLCIWRIHGGPNHLVALKITNLKTYNGADFVRILDGDTCGSREIRKFGPLQWGPQKVITSTSNAMTIVVRSLDKTSGNKLMASYNLIRSSANRFSGFGYLSLLVFSFESIYRLCNFMYNL